MKVVKVGVILSCLLAARMAAAQAAPNELTAAERRDGWQLLFDGHSLRGWHGLGRGRNREYLGL